MRSRVSTVAKACTSAEAAMAHLRRRMAGHAGFNVQGLGKIGCEQKVLSSWNRATPFGLRYKLRPHKQGSMIQGVTGSTGNRGKRTGRLSVRWKNGGKKTIIPVE